MDSSKHRVVCLIGAASEIVCKLGRAHTLVARSHECKTPWSALKRLPEVSSPVFDTNTSSTTLDREVRGLAQKGLARYTLDFDLIKSLRPTIIISQDQCAVCAVTTSDVQNACRTLFGEGCTLVSLSANMFEDIAQNIGEVAAALECSEEGNQLVAQLDARCDAVQTRCMMEGFVPVRVACLQWILPLMGAGYWVPKMVEYAGGKHVVGRPGEPTPVIDMEHLKSMDPEVIVVMCCGYSLPRALEDVTSLELAEGWSDLRAVRSGRVLVADGHLYFNNSGPGYADSVELLAEMLHPKVFGSAHAGAAYVQWPHFNPKHYPGQRLLEAMRAAGPEKESELDLSSQKCRNSLIAATQQISRRHNLSSEECCIVLSGGVDTCAVMESVSFLHCHSTKLLNSQQAESAAPQVVAAVTVFASAEATDRDYAPFIAQQFGLDHHCIDVTLEKVLEMLPFCVTALETFDPMELRNSMVVALALHKVKDLGYKVAFTGDGSDELLGGYSFTWGSPSTIWKEKRDQMAQFMNFAAPAMARKLGIVCVSPFLEHDFISFAMSTTKADCVGDREMETSPGNSRLLHTTGKVCLREAFPDSSAAWRRKDPIEVGSGSTEFGKGYFDALIGATELEIAIADVLRTDNVVIRDAEHLHYYRAFVDMFPSGLPGVERWGLGGCIGCGYALKSVQSNFCNICGAYPATTDKHTV